MGSRFWAANGRRAVVGLLAAAIAASWTLDAQAFTLIGQAKLSVSPTSGLATATFKVRGTYTLGGSCPVGAPPPTLTFRFLWWKVSSYRVSIWVANSNSCSNGVIDSGASPSILPPSGLNYPASFYVEVNVFSGSTLMPNGVVRTLYRVLAPKTSPSPSPRPSPSQQCGLPGQPACPSPSPTACAAPSAALSPASPGGKDAVVLFALAAIGALPIGGIAMVFSPGLWTRRRRWTQLLALLGLSILLLTAAGCTWNPAQTAQVTPTQSEPSPSASPTPSC